VKFLNAGASAMLIELDDKDALDAMGLFDAVVRRQRAEEPRPLPLGEIVPAARTLLVRFEPLEISRSSVERAIRDLQGVQAHASCATRSIDVPVIYDGEDLDAVAAILGISAQQVVERHTACTWTAAFVGFAPGFAYLTGDDLIFDVPRRQEPRLRVPAGSVGLAGSYSGVYPRESSGGWQLIGSTPLAMWDEHHDPPALVRPGDSVSFHAVRERIAADGCNGDAGGKAIDAAVHTNTEQATALAAREDTPGTVALGVEGSTAVHGLCVVRPGALALFEDDGRTAADMGVTGSGAADPIALHRANDLVGNPAASPAIEIAGGGARFAAAGDVVVAIAGAPAPITVYGRDDSVTAIHRQEALLLLDGDEVEIGAPRSGLRDYLALRGGFAVNTVLGSASGDMMSHIGPGPIHAGDFLACAAQACAGTGPGIAWQQLPQRDDVTELTLTLGPRDDWFTAQAVNDLLKQDWEVTAHSDRVGLRLHGQRPLRRAVTAELASEGTLAGAIEVPGNGQPVLFLRDHPVTGGYPVIAVLDADSLVLAGQLPAGALLRFRVQKHGPDAQHGDIADIHHHDIQLSDTTDKGKAA
jgi:KipI family sensor histidine kinase inhibitor